MKLNLIGPFVVNAPFGTEIAFSKGLKALGHEVVEVDPNLTTYCPEEADATVVFKSCVGHEEIMLRGLKHPVVIYQPDDARYPHIRDMMLMMAKYGSLFLSFDDFGANLAKTMGYGWAETLLLTADPELYSPSPTPIVRDIDVSFIGSLSDPVFHKSRRRMIQIVQNVADHYGWKTHWEVTQDIPHVVDVYRRSKIVINHATDVGQPFGWGYGLQCRHFEVAMTHTALLSNSEYGGKWTGLTYDGEDSLIERLIQVIDGNDWQMWADFSRKWVTHGHMPTDRAQQLVDFITRNYNA